MLPKLLTVINGLGWGFEGVPYGCLLISFKWNQSAALERGEKMSIQEWLLCTVMGTVPAGHRAIAGQMRYLQSPSVPKVLAFFMGGLSQGPLGVTERLMGEPLGFLFPERWMDS